MVSNAAKALIIIACITTGIFAVLFAPLQEAQYQGTSAVQYSASVDQINLITNSDIADIQISYATDPEADLINLTYFYILRHAIVFSPPNITVSFINSTSGKILTLKLTVDFPTLGFTSIAFSRTHLTINPKLLSNLSVHVVTGNIDLDNTYSQNKTFIDVDLRTSTGNIDIDLVNNSLITGQLHLRSSSGNLHIEVGTNARISGNLQANTTSGNIYALLEAGVTLEDDFVFKTNSGNVDLMFSNISLNSNEVVGTVGVLSGNIYISIQQFTDLSGNLTLDAKTSSGNINLDIDLEADYISSFIVPTKISGNINYFPNPPAGFHPDGANIDSDPPDCISNIDANLHTNSGNINIFASRT